MKDWQKLQPALEFAARHLGRNVRLRELAARAGHSSFHTLRVFRAAYGETPKQFTLRLRVDCAAAALVSSRRSILDIALACGFESHEAFCRAFRRRYLMTPGAYRRQGLNAPDTALHVRLVKAIGPCIGLYHAGYKERRPLAFMEYQISRQELAAQPVLVVRRRVPRAAIADTIGAELPKVFLHAQQQGIAIAGFPITRYPETTMGTVTLETGMRVTESRGEWTAAAGGGEVLAETLPAGPAAVTVHSGPYDQLPAAYAALEAWIAANGFRAAGAPWEAYLNDPGDHPDPKDWKTEVVWPFQP